MNGKRAPKPSPLAGEGAERLRREAGEGALAPDPSAGNPSPDRSPAEAGSRPPSPARGEGDELAARPVPLTASVGRARVLRSRMTDAEYKLWFALRDRRFANFKFRRQGPIGPFIADFACYQARLVIEVDGGQHAESSRDAKRDEWFNANGFVVLRFWNHDVLLSLDGVLTSILEALRERTAPDDDDARKGVS